MQAIIYQIPRLLDKLRRGAQGIEVAEQELVRILDMADEPQVDEDLTLQSQQLLLAHIEAIGISSFVRSASTDSLKDVQDAGEPGWEVVAGGGFLELEGEPEAAGGDATGVEEEEGATMEEAMEEDLGGGHDGLRQAQEDACFLDELGAVDTTAMAMARSEGF